MRRSLPNMLTVGRIVLILPFTLLLLTGTPGARWFALFLFAAASATDWLDGYLARRWGQLTPLGRMLDPIADKLLVATALLVLVATGAIAGWSLAPAIAILFREIAVSGFREHLGPMGVTVPVTQLAKWKTTAQLIALGLLVAPMGGLVYGLGVAGLWIAAALTLITGWGYFRVTVKALNATPPSP